MALPRHVVVCGAGVIGASVAYFLTRRGIAVTVVERSGVACAASGKSGGFLALDWCDGSPLGPLARASFTLHAELARELAGDYGYRRVDTFMLAARERGTPSGGHRVAAPAGSTAPVSLPPRLDRPTRPRKCSRRASLGRCSTRPGRAAPRSASGSSSR